MASNGASMIATGANPSASEVEVTGALGAN
jgi:hypothetical protein